MGQVRVGSIVLYGASPGKVLPAIVTYIWSDELVNLYVFLDGACREAVNGPVTYVIKADPHEDEGAEFVNHWKEVDHHG